MSFTFYVQASFFVHEVWLAGAAIGGLATNLLVVNNLRDSKTDAGAGKRTLVVCFGRRAALFQYAGGLVLAGTVPVALALWAGYGVAVLLPVLLAPFGWRLQLGLNRAASGADFNAMLARTGAFLLAYGAAFAAGLLLA